MSQDRALIVFAKVPVPGTVKTRLTTLLAPQEAADLYAAFLGDALLQYASLDVDVRLYVAPSEADMPSALVPASVTQHVQQGADLGARMQHAFLETFAVGYQEIAIIGTDHPTLPYDIIEIAFEVLSSPKQVVLGPSEDGGYYLLGKNAFYGELFKNMTYSHADVLAQTIERVETTTAALMLLPMWYDVDTPDDLHRLNADLAESPIPLVRTREVMQRLASRYPIGAIEANEQSNVKPGGTA